MDEIMMGEGAGKYESSHIAKANRVKKSSSGQITEIESKDM
jgi:hypothetical protein